MSVSRAWHASAVSASRRAHAVVVFGGDAARVRFLDIVDSCKCVGANVLTLADSPYCVKDPTATVQDNQPVVSWKAAWGKAAWAFGGSPPWLSPSPAPVTATSQCFATRDNPVKWETTNVNATGQFPVRNAQTTDSVAISPLSTLTRSGNEHVRILPARVDVILIADHLSPVDLTSA